MKIKDPRNNFRPFKYQFIIWYIIKINGTYIPYVVVFYFICNALNQRPYEKDAYTPSFPVENVFALFISAKQALQRNRRGNKKLFIFLEGKILTCVESSLVANFACFTLPRKVTAHILLTDSW